MPKNTTEQRLGDICDIQSGYAFPKRYQGQTDETYPFAKVGDISAVARSGGRKLYRATNSIGESTLTELNARTVPKNAVLFAKIGEAISQNFRVLAGKEMVVDNNVMALLPDETKIEPEFLYYLMLNINLYELAQSTTVPSLRKSDLAEISIPVPPLPTQRRIAARLDALTTRADRARDHLEEIPNLVDNFRKSLLARAFTGELTADWRAENPDVEPASQLLERIKVERKEKWIHNYAKNLADRARKRNEKKGESFTEEDWQAYYDKKIPQGEDRYEEPEPVDPDEEDLPEIPETWEWTVFEELVVEIRNGISTVPDDDTGLPVLRISSVRPLALDLDEVRYLDESPQDHRKYELKQGDLLVTRYNGNPRFVGACTVVPETPRTIYFPDKLMRVRVPKNLLLPKYFALVLSSGITRRSIARKVKSAAGQKGISQTDLERIPVPLAPLAEQREIIRKFKRPIELIERVRSKIATKTNSLNRLSSSLLSTTLNPTEPTTSASR